MVDFRDKRVVATFEQSTPYFKQKLDIKGRVVTFPTGSRIKLTADENLSFSRILHRLRSSDPDLEYPATGNEPRRTSFCLDVIEPPELVMSVKAVSPNPNTPKELKELQTLLRGVNTRLIQSGLRQNNQPTNL